MTNSAMSQQFTRCRLLLAVILSSLSLGFAVVLGWYLAY